MGREQQSSPGSRPVDPTQDTGRVRQHPPCELCVRLARRQLPAEGVEHEGRRHHRHPRADRRHLLWRTQGTERRAAGKRRVGHDDLQRGGSPADHARGRTDRARIRPASADPLY